MKQSVFALVDCNNFFVSCERLFRPDLEGKPVVVLSSNDGCAVARSNEAKALGIPMGAPAFKYRQLFRRHNVVQFSANFELYGDISRRIVQILTKVTPRIEVYSIDESFLDLAEIDIKNYRRWALELKQKIWQEAGIPVSIGIAPTKTLAKLASDHAKRKPELGGVLSIVDIPEEDVSFYRQLLPVEDVWGVGRRLAPQLMALGILNAQALAQMRPQFAQQLMGIHGRQMVAELNGISCFGLEQLGSLPKSIARTRTFGEDTNQIHVLESALTSFAAQAAYRLRASGQLTRRAGLFATTNRHKPHFHSWTSELAFDTPTADSGLLARALVTAFAKIYDKRHMYHRAGVWLYDFVPINRLQTDLLGHSDLGSHKTQAKRMQALDAINARYGKHTVRFAAEDLARGWEPVHKLRSPRYVSNWNELPEINLI